METPVNSFSTGIFSQRSSTPRRKTTRLSQVPLRDAARSKCGDAYAVANNSAAPPAVKSRSSSPDENARAAAKRLCSGLI